MKVLKFGFFDKNDHSDSRFKHLSWSRAYEYPFALNEIKATGLSSPKVHNASWGFEDIHIVFKTWLDVHYDTLHSDIKSSEFYKTTVWDITQPFGFKDVFDVVINISTIEEVPRGDHVEIIKNHLDQVKPGGYFILTFDYPGIRLNEVEAFVGEKIKMPAEPLNPKNSVFPDTKLGLPESFKVGYLVIQK